MSTVAHWPGLEIGIHGEKIDDWRQQTAPTKRQSECCNPAESLQSVSNGRAHSIACRLFELGAPENRDIMKFVIGKGGTGVAVGHRQGDDLPFGKRLLRSCRERYITVALDTSYSTYLKCTTDESHHPEARLHSEIGTIDSYAHS